MTSTSPFVPRPHVSATPTQEEGMVPLDRRTDTYWQMNATVALVLRALLDGATHETVAARLAERYPAAGGHAAGDVAAFVRQLRDAELVSAPEPP